MRELRLEVPNPIVVPGVTPIPSVFFAAHGQQARKEVVHAQGVA